MGTVVDAVQLAAVFLVILIASATQAATGFGFSLVAVPLLTMATGPRVAVVGSSLVALLLTAMTAVRDRSEVTWRPVSVVLVASAAGMPAGLYALTMLPAPVLTATIAGVVLGFTALIWRGLRIPGGMPTFVAVGVLCGALATATGMNGPPLVATLQSLRYPPRPFRATLSAIFVGSGIIGTVGFALAGQLNGASGIVALTGVPAAIAGWYLGDAVFSRISAPVFRRVVLATLAATAVVTLLTVAW